MWPILTSTGITWSSVLICIVFVFDFVLLRLRVCVCSFPILHSSVSVNAIGVRDCCCVTFSCACGGDHRSVHGCCRIGRRGGKTNGIVTGL